MNLLRRLSFFACFAFSSSLYAFPYFTVTASIETDITRSTGDSADDPAIWVHPTLPEDSVVLGSDKQKGLAAYDLRGNELDFFPTQGLNNVDVAYDIPGPNFVQDVIVSSNKRMKTIEMFRYDSHAQKLVKMHTNGERLTNQPYGLCLYKDIVTQTLYAFVTSYEGSILQLELIPNGRDAYSYRTVRQIQLSSQTEGCVSDIEYGIVYFAEEEVGIWKFDANPGSSRGGTLIASIQDNPELDEDIEGLTLYYTSNGGGYLLASIQGRSEFATFDRVTQRYIGSFTIKDGMHVDGVTETDGIDVSNVNLGPAFPKGIFVAQDDADDTSGKGEDERRQNFKIVSWERLSRSSADSMVTDPGWNPRHPICRMK